VKVKEGFVRLSRNGLEYMNYRWRSLGKQEKPNESSHGPHTRHVTSFIWASILHGTCFIDSGLGSGIVNYVTLTNIRYLNEASFRAMRRK